ncbi:MAG: alpha-E domain-containing protein [Acidimicrobiia bacterium]|nr:alpha-E domain-containing protein [Actinomycetota bacterium]MBL6924623.1 alpha-E domain-containing protein [Acidimicrobiia bacterium]MBL6925946.1 alpha-E domain-containing protein [Acidimicrobiia bacterium]
MLARHAESLFWAGRYLERAEDTARILDATQHATIIRPDAATQWEDLLTVLRINKEFEATGNEVDWRGVGNFLVADPENPGSIASAVQTARENLRSVREQLPSEVWETANRFHLELSSHDLAADLDGEPYTLFDLIKTHCQTVSGAIEQNMPRSDGYRFLTIGVLIERALMTSRLLSIRWGHMASGAFEDAMLTLSSVSAVEAFRRRHQSTTDPVAISSFLLRDALFPRSTLYCLSRAELLLDNLVDRVPGRGRTETVLGRVRSSLEFAELDEGAVDIPAFCAELDDGIRQVADVMARQYFRNVDQVNIRPQVTVVSVGGRR